MPSQAVTPFAYRAFGLTLASEIELPELRMAPEGSSPDVDLKLGPPPDVAGPMIHLSDRVRVGPSDFEMDVPDCARIAVRSGREIWVDIASVALIADARTSILGSAMGALLHQRGLLPLHASAVDLQGAIAFLGTSGAGKSTIAMALNAAGWPLVCDDICALDPEFRAFPGLTTLKLWATSLPVAALDAEGLTTAPGERDKYLVPGRRLAPDGPTPLRAVFVLTEGASTSVTIERMRGVDAVKALIENTFRGQLVAPMRRQALHTHQCLELARKVPVFRFERPMNLQMIGEGVRCIEAILGSRTAKV